MSEQTTRADAPTWDLADRMRKSLRHSDIGVQDMADYLGVARNTVSTWINGRIVPTRQTLLLWAMRTGVSYDWLCPESEAAATSPLASDVTASGSAWTSALAEWSMLTTPRTRPDTAQTDLDLTA